MDWSQAFFEVWKFFDRSAFLAVIILFITALFRKWLVLGREYREAIAERDKARHKLERILDVATAGASLAEKIWKERAGLGE